MANPDLLVWSNTLFATTRLNVRAKTPDTPYQPTSEKGNGMSLGMDDEGIERLIGIIGDGDLTAEAQERLHQEGLWPLYETLRQTAYEAFAFGHRNVASVIRVAGQDKA
jgi:hypothetical protein